jgi:bifunctional non-homologous end joining protein LigD
MTSDPDVELSHLDKVLFPGSGRTKGDLIAFYRRIAPTALPHYRDRALTMQRFPDGIDQPGFFQKNAADHYPGWIESALLEKHDGQVEHVLVNDRATLIYLANQGCITFHLALARIDRPHHPDRLIFDLDPSDDDFEKVRAAAQRLRDLLDSLELKSYVQTTGSRGLHVVVPLDRQAGFERVREFAREVAEALQARTPELVTTEQRKTHRGNRVFIDYLRNAYGQTAVAPYSVRALEGAPVATPVRWHEIGAADLHPRRYTIGNLFRRLGQMRDPWADIDRCAQSLDSAEASLGS